MIFQTRQRPLRQNRNYGFTLLELIFVAAILVFIATLAVPQFRKTFDSLQLQNFISDVVSFARYAQSKAITDGTINKLIFNVKEKIFAIETYAGIKTGDEGTKEKWEEIKSKKMPDFVSVDLEDAKDGIKFYPDGTADKATIKINISSGKNYTISVEQATGYVKVEELPQ